MKLVRTYAIIIIACALAIYFVPRMTSKSTFSSAEAFITGAPNSPPDVVKFEKVQTSIFQQYPAARHVVIDAQYRDEKTTETPSGKGARYVGTVTATVQFPDGIAPECLPNSPNRPWGCQYVDVPPIPINSTLVLEGVLELKRDMPDEPWKGGVPCCMKRIEPTR